MSNIASIISALIFGMLGSVIGLVCVSTWLGVFSELPAIIGITIILITVLAGFYFGGRFGKWLSSKIWQLFTFK